MQALFEFLRAKGWRGVALEADHVAVVLPSGRVEIWHEEYGREFYGHLLRETGERTELIALARQCGIRTQFMYHDDASRLAVFDQIERALRGVGDKA